MRLVQKLLSLSFVAEGNETDEQRAFLKLIKQYDLIAHGASVRIYKDKNLIAQVNSFDKSILVCEIEGIELANAFGGKRFIVGNARAQLTAEQAKASNAVHFSRDRSFPMIINSWENIPDMDGYTVKTWDELQKDYKTDKYNLYVTLASLFARCADYIPAKQADYTSDDKLENIYCFYNCSSQHAFLLNKSNEIVGAISMTEGGYLYNEAVDYFKLLSPKKTRQLMRKLDELHNAKDEAEKATLKQQIAERIKPSHLSLMSKLFEAARKCFGKEVKESDAFIRMVADHVVAYQELGCGEANESIYVIHGGVTNNFTMIDTFMKEWVKVQVNSLKPKPSQVSMFDQPEQTKQSDLRSAQVIYKNTY